MINRFTFVLKNIEGSAFRSWVAFLCAALTSGFLILGTIMIGGAQSGMQNTLDRLGADIIVVPNGTREKMENAFLMAVPATIWMPQGNMELVARVPGVAAVSPQLFLTTLRGASCCEVPEMFLVAYDPQSDFTLKPWLEKHAPAGLNTDEAIGGSYVFLPDGQAKILIYGSSIRLVGNLEPTGTGLDQSMFFTFATANDLSKQSEFKADKKLEIPSGSVSAVMVKVGPHSDPHQVAQQIRKAIPGLDPVESSNMFRSQRDRLLGLLKTGSVLLGFVWILSVLLIGLVFSMVINERRRQVAVLRALGARQNTILVSLLSEALLLALFGGMAGAGLSLLGLNLFHNALVQWMGMPFPTPSALSLILLVAAGLAAALITVIPAALLPSIRISRMEPAQAMRK